MKIVDYDVWTVVVPARPGTVNRPEFGPATWGSRAQAHHPAAAAACNRNCVLPNDPVGSWVREDDLIADSSRFEDGRALVPDAPGLGCEPDEAADERYAVPAN